MKTKNQQLLEQFNKAFARSDTDFILQHVSDTIKWTAVGDFSVEGKEDFRKALESMTGEEPYELDIHKIITHGKEAAVNGVIKSKDGKQYAFCDVYTFSGFKDVKIIEMTSYVMEIH
ncbi:MAG: nuclear transport factor 2 family protein [Gracilimonas sp.]